MQGKTEKIRLGEFDNLMKSISQALLLCIL